MEPPRHLLQRIIGSGLRSATRGGACAASPGRKMGGDGCAFCWQAVCAAFVARESLPCVRCGGVRERVGKTRHGPHPPAPLARGFASLPARSLPPAWMEQAARSL